METLKQSEAAFSDTEPKLYLLPDHNSVEDWRRWRTAGIVSVAIHVVLLITLLLLPEIPVAHRIEPPQVAHRVTKLYIPTEFTQKTPNKGKVVKELTAEAIVPRPVLRSPAPAAPAKRIPPPTPAPVPPPQVAQVQPKPVIAEPPKIEVETPAPPPQQTAQVAPPPPPPAEPPKLSLQNIAPPPAPHGGATQGQPTGGIALPNTSVQEAIRSLARNGAQSGQSVGDAEDLGGTGPGLNLPPSAGRPRSNLQLKSDPMGVDFRPYLLQVLAAVRRNWFAVYPEAARLGQRGQVVLEFSIAKQGLVVKVVYSTESGAKALDQAAVAAVSASNPLPPLPTDFKGDHVNLQMTFLYNMPR
jgi:TonB family protein